MTTNTRRDADRTVAGLVAAIRAASTAADFGPELARTVLRERLADGGDWLDRRYQHRPSDRDWMLYPLYRAPDRRCSMLVAVFAGSVVAGPQPRDLGGHRHLRRI